MLRAELIRLHAAALAAIVPGLDLDAWHRTYFTPLVVLRVDAWVSVSRSTDASVRREHAAIRAEFYPREDALLVAAEQAAKTRPTRRARGCGACRQRTQRKWSHYTEPEIVDSI